MTALTFALETLPTPIGTLLILTDAQQRLRAVEWEDLQSRLQTLLQRQYRGHMPQWHPRTQASPVRQAFADYFAGDLGALDALPTAAAGSEFQQAVWTALRRIPVGQVVSYGDLAVLLARPNASRAVGLANGANPISLAVPCHRVIGRNGALTGYGGGLMRKRWLLAHEQVLDAAGQIPASGWARLAPEHGTR